MKKTRYRILYYNLLVSALTLLLIYQLGLREVYLLMFLYSFSSLVVFGLLALEELKNFRGLNMNLLVLMGCFMRFVLPSITKAWGAMNGEEYAFLRPENVINDYMFPTVVWMNIYYSLFYWCFVRFESKYTIEDGIKPLFNRFNLSLVSVPLFIVGIAYNIVSSFVPAGIIPDFINTIFGQLATMAILIQMFNALFHPSKFNKLLFGFFIVVSIWQTTVYGFYKGAIMMNFVYYLLYYFLKCKYNHQRVITPKLIIAGILLFLTIDLIIYPFMTTKRVVAGWDISTGMASNSYSNVDILLDVLQGRSLSEKGDNTAAGRLDAVEANSFFYKECQVKGLRTMKLAKSNAELLVPRFINPNKHDSEAGLMVYAYATTGSFDNYDTALSNNYIGQFASAYLMGGVFLSILLALANGWFIMFYYNYLLKHINNIIAIILLVPLLLSAIYAFEEIHDGGVLRTGYNIVMMLVLAIVTKCFPRFLRIKYK